MAVSRLSRLQSLLYGLGLFPPSLKALGSFPRYLREYREFRRRMPGGDGAWALTRSPMLPDRFKGSGELPRHYFIQDLVVARRIHERAPKRHVDVGSRLDGFVGHVASFRELEVLDIRPSPLRIKNISFRRGDIMALDDLDAGCCDSLSCLHTIEHLGLGRYGDPIDPHGHEKGLQGLARMLVPGGVLYLSAPIGRQEVQFNDQRVFCLANLLELASRDFLLRRLSYIDDAEELHEDVAADPEQSKKSFGCGYGLAIMELERR